MNDKPAIALAKLPGPKQTAVAVARVGLHTLGQNRPFVVAGVMNRITGVMGNVQGKTLARNMCGMLIRRIVPNELKMR